MASSIGVENCWSAWLSWDRRVWVGRSADLVQHVQHARRRGNLGADGWAELADEQDGRGFAGVVRRLPVPGAGRIGVAKGALHSGPQRDGIDAVAAFEMRQKETRGFGEASRHVDLRT